MMTKDVSERELVFRRTLNAPRELVFDVWTKPEHLQHWWGPNGFAAEVQEMNLVAGGMWKLTMTGPDGRKYPNKMIFLEVQKPEKLVYIHTGDDESEPVAFHITVTFEKNGDKTDLTMRQLFPSAAERARIVREYGAEEGGKQHLANLDQYLQQLLRS